MATINKVSGQERINGLHFNEVTDDRELLYLAAMAHYLTQMHQVVMQLWDSFGKSVAKEMKIEGKKRIIKQKLHAEESVRAQKVYAERRKLAKIIVDSAQKMGRR